MQKCSIIADLMEELARHKWNEGCRLGYDLGDRAIDLWEKQHWYGYVRERWIQHITGTNFWEEFNPQEYDIIHREHMGPDEVVEFVIEKLRWGWEQLDFCHRQYEKNVQPEYVHIVLSRLNINDHRYEFKQFYRKNQCECRN